MNSAQNDKYFRNIFSENQNTDFYVVAFVIKSWSLWENMEKFGTARQATDNMIQGRQGRQGAIFFQDK